jgi:hypothetical protein
MVNRFLKIALLVAFSLCGCSSRHKNLDAMIKRLAVSENEILLVTNGASFDAVKKTLGVAARHEFTAMVNSNRYTLVSCFFASGDNALWFLFRDKILIKIIKPLAFPELLETYPFEGTTATRLKSWEVDDPVIDERIKKVIDAPGLNREQVIEELRSDKKITSGSFSVASAFLLSRILSKESPEIENDYGINENNFKLYDGCLTSIGMDTNEVVRLYGNPLRVIIAKNGLVAQIYGDVKSKELQVDPQLAFRGLAIVSDTKSRVKAVYSDVFFNSKWQD